MELVLKYFDFNYNIIEIILLALFATTFIIQVSYYLGFFRKFISYKKPEIETNQQAVSIVICAKNEEENLQKNLPLILEQDYSNFEVIVVNDGSFDDTDIILSNIKGKYPQLIISTIPQEKKFHFGKKLAATVGIKAANNEIILFTDADCRPVSNQWLKSIQQNFTKDTEIVLGYGKYESKSGILNKLIRFDTMFIALQYFSFAIAKIPYMGVGRNLAYKKSLFFNNKGFASHLKLSSGDDDLFINETANKTNTKVEFSVDSHTISEPEESYEKWSNQKRRHLTTGKYYKSKHKRLLFFENLSRAFFYILFILLLFFTNIIGYIVSIFIIRLIIQLIIIKKSMRLLNEKDLLLYSPIFDLIMPFLNLNFIISNRFTSKHNRWN